jgi:hypothetical protein
MSEKSTTRRWIECDGVGCDGQTATSEMDDALPWADTPSYKLAKANGWQRWNIHNPAPTGLRTVWLCPVCHEKAYAIFGEATPGALDVAGPHL